MRVTRLIPAVATVLAVSLAVFSTAPAAAHSVAPGGAIETRIGARWLEDGRIEVALQARSNRGAWGEVLLPRNRLMPAGSAHTRWLSTSAVALPNGEVRAVAQTSRWRRRHGRAAGARPRR